MTHLVSIVMPTYNSRDYVVESIESCLSQTYPQLEIIVVDDGSSDGTPDLIQSNYGEKVHLIKQANAGPAVARNRGIEAANGDFIKFLDSDDVLYPTYIEKCLQKFETTSEKVGVVYSRFRSVNANGVELARQPEIPLLNGDIFCDILQSNGTAILTSTTMVCRTVFEQIHFSYDELFRWAEDWDFFLNVAHDYHYAAVDEILLDYRVHELSLVQNNWGNAYGRLRVIENAADLLRTNECLSATEYNRLLAGRHHVVAMEMWKMNKRASARISFKRAIELVPEDAKLRRLYLLLTYFAPASFALWLNRWLKREKSA